MDFTLTPNSDGTGADMSYDKSSGLFNNVYLSLEIMQGSWWFNPSFGLKKRSRLKNTPATARLLQQDTQAALQWLLDNGLAVSVVVTPLAVPEDRFRLRMQSVVTAANGEIVTYSKYVQVV